MLVIVKMYHVNEKEECFCKQSRRDDAVIKLLHPK